MKAKLVIITGRKRKPRRLDRGGFDDLLPGARCSTAKATIRMPFLAASAISTTRPICA